MVYSEPFLDVGETGKTKEGTFTFPGINLMVVPHNSDIAYGLFWYVVPLFPTPGRTTDHSSQKFWITLVLDPEGEEFSLDLRRITLDLNGEKYVPTSFKGPVGGAWRYGCNELSSLSPKSVNTYYERPQPVTDWSCISVKFDTSAPSPEQAFILNIDGVFRGGKPFPVPPLRFQKNLGWQMHRDL